MLIMEYIYIDNTSWETIENSFYGDTLIWQHQRQVVNNTVCQQAQHSDDAELGQTLLSICSDAVLEYL